MKNTISSKISFLYFSQFAISGLVFSLLPLYLKAYLFFSGRQLGIVMAGAAVTAVIGPVLNTVVAERWLSTERLFGICHFLGGGVMFFLSYQTRFLPFFILYLIYYTQFGPSFSLLNATAFHNAPEGRTGYFSGVRVWGTIGWVFIAFSFSFIWLRRGGDLHGLFYLAAGLGWLACGFTLVFIPAGELRAAGRKKLFPTEVLSVFRRKEILILAAAFFCFNITEKMFYFCLSIFIRGIGVSEAAVLPLGALAQITEILAMFFFPIIFVRLGTRKIMLAGALLVSFKFICFAFGSNLPTLVFGLLFHGPAYAFMAVASISYLDTHCEPATRTGVHQFFMLLETGAANLLGNLLSGQIMELAGRQEADMNFRLYWIIPASIGLFLFFFLLFIFPRDRLSEKTEV